MTSQRISAANEVVSDEIPRHRFGGPYLIPPGKKHVPGDWRCGTCGRMVAPKIGARGKPVKGNGKGSCKCMYHKRTTNFIDVIQDEYLLKRWGKRNVAWGMGQRPDLVLAAAACRPDSDDLQSLDDKKLLNDIADQASEVAGHKSKALIGTSLHKLTHAMDRGETLGFVPEPYPADLRAYEEATKDIEWVAVESFRVLDDWVRRDCAHPYKACSCMGVAGTVDRIGWYKGRLVIMDIKTGSDWNKAGFAMQLAMYSRMVPYIYPGDVRGVDVGQVDLNLGYVIKLPAGQGHCELEPIHIGAGWGACKVAKQVWDIRSQDFAYTGPLVDGPTLLDMAHKAGSIAECKLLWNNGKAMGQLTNEVRAALRTRAATLKERKKA